jgi:glycosyltransferase involved in cell wall biosynthesis
MRIGIDARLNAYREGGIAEYTRRLIESLALLDQLSDYSILHHVKSTTDLGSGKNFRRINLFTPCHHRLERIALAAEISRLGLDILHSPDFIPPRFGARRYVITVHDLTFVHYPQFQTPDSLRYYLGNIRNAVRQADHILADSQVSKEDMVNLLNVPPEKITVHMLGVNPIFRPLPQERIIEAQRRFGLPSSYLLFVGTFEPRKNLPGLLESYQLLRAKMSDVPPLVIVGRRGWLYEPIFQKVEDLKLRDRIIWIEDIPFADLPAIYNGATVLALPSFYEGFGFPPLEAMACGIPTVVSDRGSLPEVVGDTGLMINPDRADELAEALYRALTDNTFRQQSAEAGIARAATFTWQHTAEIVLSVYRSLAR